MESSTTGIRYISRLLALLVYGAILFSLFMLLNMHIERDTTETVFVTSELTKHIDRLKVCRCVSQITPATLMGYEYSDGALRAKDDSSVQGGFVSVTTAERDRLAKYFEERGSSERVDITWRGNPAILFVTP